MTPPPIAFWIPARRGSTRLPDKLLCPVAGEPLIAWTVRAAARAAVVLGAEVRVVTESGDIAQAAHAAGAAVTLAAVEASSGTERLALALAALPALERPEIVVNVQADEPLVPPEVLLALARFAQTREEALCTVMLRGRGEAGRVGVVTDRRGRALYFSRAALPGTHPSAASALEEAARGAFGQHVGLYAYRAALLADWPKLAPGPLEALEGLEQLRALEHGVPVAVLGLEPPSTPEPWFPIDTAEDLSRLRTWLEPAPPP